MNTEMKKAKKQNVSLKGIQNLFFRTQLILIITLALMLGIAGTVINIRYETQKRDNNLQNVAETIARSPILSDMSMAEDDVVLLEYLDTLKEGQFDLIILDPPAFTKNRRTADHAYQGYLTINRKAMRVLRNGGYLATCSCSRYMENAMFEAMLKEASADEHAVLRQIVISQQNADHPVVWTMDETSYLKFYVFQVLPQW